VEEIRAKLKKQLYSVQRVKKGWIPSRAFTDMGMN